MTTVVLLASCDDCQTNSERPVSFFANSWVINIFACKRSLGWSHNRGPSCFDGSQLEKQRKPSPSVATITGGYTLMILPVLCFVLHPFIIPLTSIHVMLLTTPSINVDHDDHQPYHHLWSITIFTGPETCFTSYEQLHCPGTHPTHHRGTAGCPAPVLPIAWPRQRHCSNTAAHHRPSLDEALLRGEESMSL